MRFAYVFIKYVQKLSAILYLILITKTMTCHKHAGQQEPNLT